MRKLIAFPLVLSVFVYSLHSLAAPATGASGVTAMADGFVASADGNIAAAVTAGQGNVARDGANAARVGASVDTSINPNAQRGVAAFGAQGTDLKATRAEAQGQLDKCIADGNAAMAAAEAALAAAQAALSSCQASGDSENPPDCSGPQADVAAAQAAKAKIAAAIAKCKTEIGAVIAQLDAGIRAANVARVGAGSTSSGSASTGGGGGEPKPPTTPTTPTAIDCAKDVDANKKPECDQYFVTNCASSHGDVKCKAFDERYCDVYYYQPTRPANASTTYCKQATAYHFCNPVGTNANCLTCKDLAQTMAGTPPTYTTAIQVDNYLTCENDVMFKDPQTLALVKANLPTPSVEYSTQSRTPASAPAATPSTSYSPASVKPMGMDKRK